MCVIVRDDDDDVRKEDLEEGGRREIFTVNYVFVMPIQPNPTRPVSIKSERRITNYMGT